MADPIHPTRAGYLEWWTPKMERAFAAFYGKSLCGFSVVFRFIRLYDDSIVFYLYFLHKSFRAKRGLFLSVRKDFTFF